MFPNALGEDRDSKINFDASEDKFDVDPTSIQKGPPRAEKRGA